METLGGSETYCFTVLEALKSLGHNVEYFTFKKGYISSKIENDLGISFMSKSKYDLILANHNTTVDQVYKKGFTIQTCHGIYPSLEQPSLNANAYVSISQEVQDYLAKLGCPSILIHNSINLDRFKPITPINTKLKSILSLCHSSDANQFVKKICEELDINYRQAFKYKNPTWHIEDEINKVDMVVGLGRSAYEAMACGRPVIVYDNRRYFESCGDGYVKDILGLSLKNNCSGRYSNIKFDNDSFKTEIEKYNSNDSFFFRKFAEKELDVNKNIQKYFEYYNFILGHKLKKNREKKIRFLKKIIGKHLYKILVNFHRSLK